MTFRFQILNVFFPLVLLHKNGQPHDTLALPLSSHTPRTHLKERERERERSTRYKSKCQFIKRNISHIRVDLKWGAGAGGRGRGTTPPPNKQTNNNNNKTHAHSKEKSNRKKTRLRISLIREPSMETKSSS